MVRFFAAALFPVLAAVAAHAGDLAWDTTRIERVAEAGQESADETYRFRNTGANQVIILETKSNCGCTVATLDKSTYAPGEEGSIRVKFKFGELTGLQQKTVTVVSSDATTQPTELVLRVAIPEPVIVEPGLLIWNNDPTAAKAETKSASIVSANGKPFAVALIYPDNDQFETKLVTETDGLMYKLLVTPKSIAKPGKTILRIELVLLGGKGLTSTVYAVIK